jgi:hypothetical protein
MANETDQADNRILSGHIKEGSTDIGYDTGSLEEVMLNE